MQPHHLKRAAIGLAAIALAGCTSAAPATPLSTAPSSTRSTTVPGDTHTEPRPSSTAAATATATAKSNQPTGGPPTAATRRTEAGGLAYVRYFMVTFNRVSVRPSPGQLAALSEETCKTCRAFEDAQRYYAQHGQHFETPPVRLERVSATPGFSPDRSPYRIVADVTSLGVAVVDPERRVVERDPKKTGTYSFFLTWTADGWKVSEIKVVA